MGVKRPLEDEHLHEITLEQSKQLNNKKPAFDFPSQAVSLDVYSPGEAKSDFCKLDSDGRPESGGIGDAFTADKEVEACEEDVGIKNSSCNVPGCIEFDMALQLPQQLDNPYTYFMNVAPRKEIPIGPDYQAEVPKWDPSASGKDFLGSNNDVDNEWEKKWIGTCITTMPSLNDVSADEFTVGRGKTTDCSCIDMGSMRCVQQHVREAREKLRDTLGDEIFTKLGFYEMGEEIASRWSFKDQQLFHQIVISNPGTDFWRLLSAVLPTRTKRELISYYFNVFVLRRRGVQNRSYLLQIDSDDDEELNIAPVDHQQNRGLVDDDAEHGNDLLHGNVDFQLVVVGGEEDSEVESFGDQELDLGWVDECGSEPENGFGDEGINVNGGTSNGYAVEKDGANEGHSDDHVTNDVNGHKQDGA